MLVILFFSPYDEFLGRVKLDPQAGLVFVEEEKGTVIRIDASDNCRLRKASATEMQMAKVA